MRLNLGCGDHYVEGWHNVDLQSCPHRVDDYVDLREPLSFTGLTHVYAGHVLEHLTRLDVVQLLCRLAPCMASGGQLMLVGPDVVRGEEMCARGDISADLLNVMRFGEKRWPGDDHLWECEPGRLTELLDWTENWTDIREVPIAQVGLEWPVVSRVPWQCAVSATVSPKEDMSWPR